VRNLKNSALAYLLYDKNHQLTFYSPEFSEILPAFAGLLKAGQRSEQVWASLIGNACQLTRLRAELDGENLEEQNELARENCLEVTLGSFCTFDDVSLPDGGMMTLVRDVTGLVLQRRNIARLQIALERLSVDKAFEDGDKAIAFRRIAEVSCWALGVLRFEVWLLNVDGSALHVQEGYRTDGKAIVEDSKIEKASCAGLFEALAAGRFVTSGDPPEGDSREGLTENGIWENDKQAHLVFPIARGTRTIGALFVSSAQSISMQTEEQISFIRYMSDLVIRTLDTHDRNVAEEGLRSFNELLDVRVQARTKELENTLETLKKTQSELVRSAKLASLGGLVAGVAHEINTPLGVALTTITELGADFERLDQQLKSGAISKTGLESFLALGDEASAVIQRNLERAATLIQSFRMVAVDQAVGDRRELDLGTYLSEIIDNLKPTLRMKSVAVSLSCKPDVKIKTIPGDLAHILTNLIMNSVIHGFKGRETQADKSVNISVNQQRDFIYMTLVDNGVGIPNDIRDKVFDPFFTTARGEGGSGLGLNIVYNTVYQKLKGSIELSDSDGGGACFNIRFPVNVPAG